MPSTGTPKFHRYGHGYPDTANPSTPIGERKLKRRSHTGWEDDGENAEEGFDGRGPRSVGAVATVGRPRPVPPSLCVAALVPGG